MPRKRNIPATAPPIRPMTAAKYHKDTPAANITAAPATISINEVPRFGSRMTRIVGKMINSTGISTHSGRDTRRSSSQS